MRRAHLPENLPALISELVFVALLVVGVMLFFLWATRSRSQYRGTSRSTASLQGPARALAEAREEVRDQAIEERLEDPLSLMA